MQIAIETTIDAPVGTVWKCWTEPAHITKWNTPSDDWHSPRAENDVRPGGSFNVRMESKDGSQGFDFAGTYDEVKPNEKITYTLGDGRKVITTFDEASGRTSIVETFEAEKQNPPEMQRQGWQAILDNFKKYVEANR